MPKSIPAKVRLDKLLVERRAADSREKAQALIMAGRVLVDGQKIEKCGASVRVESDLRIQGAALKYVSRAGLKLEAALKDFGVGPAGKVCLDVGASTGGFTQCLLEHGASRVFAVDAGVNQLDWRIRQDARVLIMEKTNARYLRPADLGSTIDLVTMDVSFISVTIIIRVLPPLMSPGGEALILVKPQFEVGRGRVGKGGIVRDPALHREAIEKVAAEARQQGFRVCGQRESALVGAEGNREFFVYAVLERRV